MVFFVRAVDFTHHKTRSLPKSTKHGENRCVEWSCFCIVLRCGCGADSVARYLLLPGCISQYHMLCMRSVCSILSSCWCACRLHYPVGYHYQSLSIHRPIITNPLCHTVHDASGFVWLVCCLRDVLFCVRSVFSWYAA